MKNTKINKIVAAGLAATAIMALSLTSVSAWQHGGHWGQNKWMGQYITAEQKAELQSMNETDRKAYIEELKEQYGIKKWGEWKSKGNWEGKKWGKEWKEKHSAGDMIADIDAEDVDAIEIDLLEKQYEEEMMANELYMSFYEMYGVETFKNIAESEAKHIKAVKALLDRYDIDAPTSYDHIQDLYDNLKAKGALSLKDALEVWVSIEIVDIDDIVTAIKSTDNEDIKTVMVNIGGASYNHMRGFVNGLANNGYTTDIDYSDYLTSEDIKTKGWALKVKLAEKLEAEWVEIPEAVSSDMIKEKCDKEKSNGEHSNEENRERKGHWKSDDMKKWQQGDIISGENSKYYDKVQEKKAEVKTKYGAAINKLSDDKLEVLVVKIDKLLEKLQNGNYSDVVKEKYIPILWALKEIINDKLGNVDFNINSIFN